MKQTYHFIKNIYLLFFLTTVFSSYSQIRPTAQILKTDTFQFNSQTISSLEDYVENPVNMELSKYGGWKARQVEATGFFRVERIDGRWWAVDPEGYLFVHKAPNSVHLDDLNPDEIHEWLHEYGFNGTGNWSDDDINTSSLSETMPMAYCPKLSFVGAYLSRVGYDGDVGMPIFNEDFQEVCDELAREAFTPFVNDPNVFGYFSDNELKYGSQGIDVHLAITDHSDINYITAINFLTARGKTADNWDEADQHAYIALMGERYYSVISSAIKKVDPNHMYLGTRCNSVEKTIEAFMTNQGKYVDILSVNHYSRWGNRQVEIQNMSEWAGKPLMTTEFYGQVDDPDVNETGAGFLVANERSRGLFYQNFVSTMAQSKYVVGMHWFAFQDKGDSHKSFVDPNGDNWPELADNAKILNDRLYDFIDYSDSRPEPDYELSPEADAFFQGGTNHGANEELWTKEGNRETYIRFDLSEVDINVASAKIKLFSVAQRSETGSYQAELVVDDSWEEMGIKNSNNPPGSTILATWSDGSDQVIDVTEEVIDAFRDNNKLSIRIISTVNNGSIPRYGSRENSNPVARPRLCILKKTTVEYVPIPALMEAEDFVLQSGTRSEPSQDTDNGTSIGHIDSDDFLSYNINVPTSGSYTIDFRVASRDNGAKLDIYEGASIIGNVSSSATGGWYDWETVSIEVNLTEGDHTLKLLATGSGWNINWINIKENLTVGVEGNQINSFEIYPNPVSKVLNIEKQDGNSYELYNQLSEIASTGVINSDQFTINLENLSSGIYFLKIKDENGTYTKKVIKQ